MPGIRIRTVRRHDPSLFAGQMQGGSYAGSETVQMKLTVKFIHLRFPPVRVPRH